MGVLLQAFFKTRPNHAVPAPVDGTGVKDWWWDRLAREAGDFARAGFTALWLPPVLKANGGQGRDVDGYGPFDDYDIGSKDQMGGNNTRFGSREQLCRLVAIALLRTGHLPRSGSASAIRRSGQFSVPLRQRRRHARRRPFPQEPQRLFSECAARPRSRRSGCRRHRLRPRTGANKWRHSQRGDWRTSHRRCPMAGQIPGRSGRPH